MSNMIQAAREQVAALTQAAYEKAAAEGLLPAGAEVKATIEIPKDVTHGEFPKTPRTGTTPPPSPWPGPRPCARPPARSPR